MLDQLVQIFHFSFSLDGNCICIGTNKGFGIYQTEGFKLRYKADIGGVSYCEMLGNTNIVALVGAGESPEFPQKKLILWDAKNEKKVCEIFYEEEKILNVKLNFSMLAVSTRQNCYIYEFPKVKLAKTISCTNPGGLIAITSNIDFNYFAYLDRTVSKEGNIDDKLALSYIPDLLKAKENKITHWSNECDISFMAFNYTGNLLAAACSQGRYINILKVPSLTKIISLHRGIDATTIHQLSFSRESSYILNTSAKGTLHIYDISSVVKAEHDNSLNGGFNFSKVAHNLFQGAKHLITGGKAEGEKDVNYSIITYDYDSKNKKKFSATFSSSNKLMYLIDEAGQFTELRVGESQIKADSIRADALLKSTENF